MKPRGVGPAKRAWEQVWGLEGEWEARGGQTHGPGISAGSGVPCLMGGWLHVKE